MCLQLYAQFYDLPTSFRDMLGDFQDLFSKDIPKGLPPIGGIVYEIDFTLGATLSNRVAYRANINESKEIQQQVDKFIEKRWGGSWRMCMDCSPLNETTIRYRYHIPHLNEQHGACIFSKIDLHSGYH
ncbi:hypothetical protein CR513_02999, partial [Mucuna pruriens]